MVFHRKHKCKVKKKPPYARQQPTNIQQALTFVLLFICKVDCCVNFWPQKFRHFFSLFTTTLSNFLHIFKIKHVGPTYALAAASSLAGKLSHPSFNSRFDSDSFRICVNTGASCSMSGNLNHFQDLLPVEHNVSGIGEQALKAKGK
jgi:hypothetical protein